MLHANWSDPCIAMVNNQQGVESYFHLDLISWNFRISSPPRGKLRWSFRDLQVRMFIRLRIIMHVMGKHWRGNMKKRREQVYAGARASRDERKWREKWTFFERSWPRSDSSSIVNGQNQRTSSFQKADQEQEYSKAEQRTVKGREQECEGAVWKPRTSDPWHKVSSWRRLIAERFFLQGCLTEKLLFRPPRLSN